MLNELVLNTDPRVQAIPIHELGDPLVDLRHQVELLYGPAPRMVSNTSYTKMRRSVYYKLLEAQRLLPTDFRICLREGLRTLFLQNFLFQDCWETIRTANPGWTNQAVYSEVIKTVSPVETLNGALNVPPHSTGAAADIYLVSQLGNPVNMDKANRKILSTAMEAAGFVNYPAENRHWSYGDRYWAFVKNKSNAFFNVIEG